MYNTIPNHNKKILYTIIGFIALSILLASFKNLNKKYEYACVIVAHRTLTNKVNITIDYGQKRPFLEDSRLTDKEGNVIKFNSAVDAINYMSEDGWTFMQTAIVPQGNTYQESIYFYKEVQ